MEEGVVGYSRDDKSTGEPSKGKQAREIDMNGGIECME